MIREGMMVRKGGGPPMRVAIITDGVAQCLQIDGRGRVLHRFFESDQLTPLWLSLQPKTTWPDPGQLDLIEIEREEMVAREMERRAKATSKRPKQSNKIRRRLSND